IAIAASACMLEAAEQANWPRFRGNNGDGIGELANPPTTWTERDFAWRTEIPGNGHSSPVAWGERLFVTSADAKTGERFVLCLDSASGRTLWTMRLPGGTYHTHA